jgi:hypothetical protein
MFASITIGALAALLTFAPAAQAGLQGGQKKKIKAENGKSEKDKAEKSKAERVFVAGPVPTSNQTINGSPYLAGEV